MRQPLKSIGLAIICVASSATVLAQEGTAATPTPPPSICETSPAFGDFDFWVGEWNVYSNDEARQFQGTNSISKHYNSCLLKENWKSAQGGGGFSINYYNSVKNEWRQVWVAGGYSIDYSGGLNDDGAMVLEGHIYNYGQDAATRFRGVWTAQSDGSVIQHFDIFDETADTWNVWFEGLYVKNEGQSETPDLSP